MNEFDTLVVEASPKTPTVNLDCNTGVLLFKGRSIPENSIDFFQPIYSWVDRYCEHPKQETTLQIRLEYFNTSSSKCILDLLRKFEQLNKEKSRVVVEWFYETDDDDMVEAGEDYQAIIELPFNMIEVEEI
jgi:hypothetical protein